MTYPQEYYDCMNKIDELKKQIDSYEKKVEDLDSDYLTLKECTMDLASCGVLLDDMLVQCKDIKKVFDRGTIEGKYDACKIVFDTVFKTKETLFGYLDIIGKSTNVFNESCSDLKSQLQEYGSVLDDFGKSIADETTKVKNEINRLNREISKIKREAWNYLTPPSTPIPPEAMQ